MEIKFKTLKATEFKSHKYIEVDYSDITHITADNHQGKTSIGEIIPWLFYGVDLNASKLNPTSVTYETNGAMASLLTEVDGVELLLGRTNLKGKNAFYINGVPSKAGEFEEVLDNLFDRELFMSLYNPSFFFTLHWEKQRDLLMRFVQKPTNKEVLEKLPKLQDNKLSEQLAKRSISDIEKVYRADKLALEKKHIQAESKTKTLKQQLDQIGSLVPLDSLRTELTQYQNERNEIEASIETQQENNNKARVMQVKLNAVVDERDTIKAFLKRIKDEEVLESCRTCLQPLKEESVLAVNEDKQKRYNVELEKFYAKVEERKALAEELKNMEQVDISEQLKKSWELGDKLQKVQFEMDKHARLEAQQLQVDAAVSEQQNFLEELNNSIFMIDAVKAFKSEESKLQAEKVSSLFDRLTIRLFDEIKTTGDLKPTFVVQMDGKDYMKLSLSESIRAGLELASVLSEQSGVVVPTFVDNAESITTFKQPIGQLITATVIAGQQLTIKGDN